MEKTSDLKTEDVFKVIDNIAKSSIVVLSLEGGDPLVRKDLGYFKICLSKTNYFIFYYKWSFA